MFNIKSNAKNWKIPTVNGVIKTGYFEEWFYNMKIRNGEKIEISEKDNIIFDAFIKVKEFGRGRSSTYFIFQDKDGINEYYTGPQGMFEILKSLEQSKFKNDYFSGTFTFKKQGDNIYLFPYED